MTSQPHIIVEGNPGLFAERGAFLFMQIAQDSVSKRGEFLVAISGGSSPRPIHRLLVKTALIEEIPWGRMHLFWVDERCVESASPESNYGNAKRDFLDQAPIPDDYVHPMPGTLPPVTGAQIYQNELEKIVPGGEGGPPVFDLICLGVGSDGHTASLFPDHPALAESKKKVVHVKGGNPYTHRLTLTYPVLNHARHIIIMALGKGKAGVMKHIAEEGEPFLPIQRIQPVAGTVTWLLDREAASMISEGIFHESG
ncbi:MAG: 6-phosphogluconolactonase [Deltaproteobacteria bacterium]|nr:6-phosphogluconolactonase [Deltaproteobacteria bacterium]